MSNTVSFPQPWVSNIWNVIFSSPRCWWFCTRRAKWLGKGCCVGPLLIWLSQNQYIHRIMTLITVTAAQAVGKKMVGREMSLSYLLFVSSGCRNHRTNTIILPYENTSLQNFLQCVLMHPVTFKSTQGGKTSSKAHWGNHAQNSTRGKGQDKAGIKHWRLTMKNPTKQNQIKKIQTQFNFTFHNFILSELPL